MSQRVVVEFLDSSVRLLMLADLLRGPGRYMASMCCGRVI